jgi:hypothetical protein
MILYRNSIKQYYSGIEQREIWCYTKTIKKRRAAQQMLGGFFHAFKQHGRSETVQWGFWREIHLRA